MRLTEQTVIAEGIYDWNKHWSLDEVATKLQPAKTVEIDDETLRDGLQNASVRHPDVSEKLKIVEIAAKLGITRMDVGLPGAMGAVPQEVETIVRYIKDNDLKIRPNCAARTIDADVIPIIEISNKVGIKIEACTFLGASQIRQYTQGWDLPELVKLTVNAVKLALDAGLPVMYVTEDTTRARPETIEELYGAAIDAGVQRICLCDTVGFALPIGVYNLVTFVREFIQKQFPDKRIYIDFHGHNDRGFGLINTLAAVEAGVDSVHATALGIGERVGNVALEPLLLNLLLEGYIDYDLTAIREYSQIVSEACSVPIPPTYPVIGKDVDRTGTGVHADATIKALKKGWNTVAALVYTGYDIGLVGRTPKIEIGPMAGRSNVEWWLVQHNITPEQGLIDYLFDAAKKSRTILEEHEVLELIENYKK